MRWLALLPLALVACDRASPTRPSASASATSASATSALPMSALPMSASVATGAGPAASASATGAAASAKGSASGSVGAGGPWVGCYSGFRPGSTPLRDVTRVGLLCGPANGMRPVAPAWEGRLDEGATREHTFAAERGQCVRVFAVGEEKLVDLDLTLLDARGATLGSDAINDRWPILPPDGTICALSDGALTVRVSARKGAGAYAAQAWLLP